ncbi:hypothetical protein ASPCADRAFT_134678 [Aspergillus carbonarius ITEM 5010]|uniref:Uncharacterized protein n=1 Tax=Aspergillus carbonarius (strain ITEM 5010) TaxID=602072 RepID=A0A1R3R8Z3_ASPC5|nr:hypothetical protein ASPCADRAFT_134678 [Aspergillus carbonarius ITEM 5010]
MPLTEEDIRTLHDLRESIESKVTRYFISSYLIGPRNAITKVEWVFEKSPTEEEKKRQLKSLSDTIKCRRESETDSALLRGFLQNRHCVQFFVERRREEGAPVDEDCIDVLPLDPSNPARTEYNTKDNNDRKIIEDWFLAEAGWNSPTASQLAEWAGADYERIFQLYHERPLEIHTFPR